MTLISTLRMAYQQFNKLNYIPQCISSWELNILCEQEMETRGACSRKVVHFTEKVYEDSGMFYSADCWSM